MRVIFRLFCDLIRLLVQWALQATLLLLGCAVRLLYWSVRTYGWGRVAGFLGALAASVWIHGRLDRLSLHADAWASVGVGTLALWGTGLWAYRTLNRWVHRRAGQRATFEVPAASGPIPNPVVQAPAASLWEAVLDPTNLQEAWQRVRLGGGSPGPDGISVEAFALEADRHLHGLAREVRAGHYRPRPVRWVEVPKPIGISRFRSGGVPLSPHAP